MLPVSVNGSADAGVARAIEAMKASASCFNMLSSTRREGRWPDLGEQTDLAAGVPEQHRLVFLEPLLPDVGNQAGHGLRGVGGIEEARLGPRGELDGFAGGIGGNAVAVADDRVVNLDRSAAGQARQVHVQQI